MHLTITIFYKISTLTFALNELDPDKVVKDQRFPKHFYCEVTFTDYCKCKNSTMFENKCKDCGKFMSEVKQQWDTIHKIMDEYRQHTQNESKIMLFGDPEFDDTNNVLYSMKTPQLSHDDQKFEDEEDEFDIEKIQIDNQNKGMTDSQTQKDEQKNQNIQKSQKESLYKNKM